MVKLKEQKMKKEAKKAKKEQKINNKSVKENEEVLKFRKEYEETIQKPTKNKTNTASIPKSQRGKKRRSPQEIREEKLKKLDDSNLK